MKQMNRQQVKNMILSMTLDEIIIFEENYEQIKKELNLDFFLRLEKERMVIE
jgi:hypothetical protein